jgi:hypothetical protein
MTEDGTDDIISRGVEICSRMPRGAAEWKDALLFLAFMLIECCPASGHAHRLDLPGSGRYRDGCPLANLYVIVF